MTCDYRIMADNPRYSIGLNETQLGIVAPFWSGTINMTTPMTVVVMFMMMMALVFIMNLLLSAGLRTPW